MEEVNMQSRPNIVVILVDDMGYSDVGCYGGEIDTSNIDSMANNGVRFTQFYNTARCCPARASLLTGLYPHQAGMGWMAASDMGGGLDGYAGDLNKRCCTFAEVLKPSGYRTYMSGKWHVTSDPFARPDGSKHNWPCQRGFDRYWGIIGGAANYYSPGIVDDNDWVGPAGLPEGQMFTEAIGNKAALFIREHAQETPESPFLEYVAFTAPHWPLHAKAETIHKYRDVARQGWDRMRRAKYDRMKELGIIEDHWNLSEKDSDIPDWETLSQEQQAEFAHRMAVYSAQIDEMDQAVGEVIAALKETNCFENTLILFMSDNGGCAEEIHRSQSLDDWHEIGQAHTWESYGKPWANYSNTPFREYKHWVHEGGIATPLVAHWPEGIVDPGRIDSQPGHLIDVMATCIELSGAVYPPTCEGSDDGTPDIHPLPGVSLTPIFRNEKLIREQIFWEHEANCALRIGKWKLVRRGDSPDGVWELYDMESDRTETVDLASRHPERVKEMAARWHATADVTDVYPLYAEVPGLFYGERAQMASWRQQ